MPSKPSGDRYYACLAAMRRFKPHSAYANPSGYFRVGEDCLRALPDAISHWRLQHIEVPPCIPCRDELPNVYMRFGRWDDAIRVVHSVLEAGAMDPEQYDETSAWIMKCKEAAEGALQCIKEHPGISSKRLYSLLPHVDREALKWFTRYSWQIERVKDGSMTALYAMGEAPGQPPEVPVLSKDSIDPSWGIAACIDVETTGLSPASHELIELAIVLFAFERETGKIMGIVDEYVGQREPRRPIPLDATWVHGLTREMLKGKTLDEDRIKSVANRAEFYIAHNAEFDCGFAQRYLPKKPWFCSMSCVDWTKYGCKRRSLPYLLEYHRIRTDEQHRAASDACAVLQLLSLTNADGETYLKTMLSGKRVSIRASEPIPHSHEEAGAKPGRTGCAASIMALALLGGLAACAIACMLSGN